MRRGVDRYTVIDTEWDREERVKRDRGKEKEKGRKRRIKGRKVKW